MTFGERMRKRRNEIGKTLAEIANEKGVKIRSLKPPDFIFLRKIPLTLLGEFYYLA